MKYSFLFAFLIIAYVCKSQKVKSDTLGLEAVIIRGFENNRIPLEIPASVSKIQAKDIENYNNQGFLPILNSIAGVKMEERSPGSYRLNIRGSNVRSPFGVRNIKIYWNNIPLTDASGLSYFNLLDINTINSIEVLKGPSGSIYGAGIGGVILLDSKANGMVNSNKEISNLKLDVLMGSFNTLNRGLSYNFANSKSNIVLNHSHVETDGYREHSKMARDVLNYRSSHYISNQHTLNLNLFYADISYQTPGGLTAQQMADNRKASRPKTAVSKSSIEQKAAIYQKMFSFGVSEDWKINKFVSFSNSIFGSFSDLKNPFISNFELRDEENAGFRSSFSIKPNTTTNIILGAEYLNNNSSFDNYDNNAGNLAALQSLEKIVSKQSSIFIQIEKIFWKDLYVTLGNSFNKQTYDYQKTSTPMFSLLSNTGKPIAPRIAILKKIGSYNSIFASYSEGFSAPTVQEFAASLNPNNILQAETASNFEIGLKSYNFLGKLNAELSLYSMRLNNAIVRRTTETNQEYFTNVGNTKQNGLELSANYPIKLNSMDLNIQTALNLNDYKYQSYVQLKNDFSNKQIPSVTPLSWFSSLDLKFKSGIFIYTMMNTYGKTPLNDANTVFADPFTILNMRLGYQIKINRIEAKAFFGVENLLNEKYSLGNDINAFGNRFYNPAATINYNGGIQVNYNLSK